MDYDCFCDCDGMSEFDIEAILLWEAAADFDGISSTVNADEIDGLALR